jgi:hypothetical protein
LLSSHTVHPHGKTKSPHGCRVGERVAHGKVIAAGLASSEVMSNSRSRRFPVTVTHLPVTRCQIRHRTAAYRPGNPSEDLTGHHRRAYPDAPGLRSQ